MGVAMQAKCLNGRRHELLTARPPETSADDTEGDPPALSHSQVTEISRAAIQALARILLSELDRDLEEIRGLETLETGESELRCMMLRARWMKRQELFHDSTKIYKARYGSEYGELKLIGEVFGDQLPFLRIVDKSDVVRRMANIKATLGKRFETKIRTSVRDKGIKSPIEQIFLMEWEHYNLERPSSLTIEPQHQLQADGRTYRLDFMVLNPDRRLRVGIELDGHDFHEKTYDQVRRDKQREWAIVRQGITVLRFSGSEVVRNARKCVAEVITFLNEAA